MSRTYELACNKCKERLWIGQGQGWPKPKILSIIKNDKTHQSLTAFLHKHFSHPLVFEDSERLDDYNDFG